MVAAHERAEAWRGRAPLGAATFHLGDDRWAWCYAVAGQRADWARDWAWAPRSRGGVHVLFRCGRHLQLRAWPHHCFFGGKIVIIVLIIIPGGDVVPLIISVTEVVVEVFIKNAAKRALRRFGIRPRFLLLSKVPSRERPPSLRGHHLLSLQTVALLQQRLLLLLLILFRRHVALGFGEQLLRRSDFRGVGRNLLLLLKLGTVKDVEREAATAKAAGSTRSWRLRARALPLASRRRLAARRFRHALWSTRCCSRGGAWR